MAGYSTQIVNDSGQTIYLKIVGHEQNAVYMPDLPGVPTGLLFAAPPQNRDIRTLDDGPRVIIVWDNTGSMILAKEEVFINAPSTITIGPGMVVNQAF